MTDANFPQAWAAVGALFLGGCVVLEESIRHTPSNCGNWVACT